MYKFRTFFQIFLLRRGGGKITVAMAPGVRPALALKGSDSYQNAGIHNEHLFSSTLT